MYKVTKEVINQVGNIQSTKFITFVSIDSKEEMDAIIRSFHGCAIADNQAFIIRGRQEKVRYKMQKIDVLDSNKVRVNNIKYTNDAINRCNKYIDEINTVAKRSAKINSKKDVDLRQYINVKEYWLDDKQDYVNQNIDDEWIVY